MSPTTGLHHVAYPAASFDEELRFWQDVLGYPVRIRWTLDDGARAAMVDVGHGNFVEIFDRPDHTPQPGWPTTHIALRTQLLDTRIDRIREAGAEIMLEPKDATIENTTDRAPSELHIRIAFFKTPGGALIELFESTF